MATFTGQGRPGQCQAKSHSTGGQCKNKSILGATVCRFHGGSAPQVKQAAQRRLALLVDPSLDVLEKVLRPGGKWREIKLDQQIKVAQDILNRNGYKSRDEILLTQEFDASKFSNLSDEELESLIALARKASTQREVSGGA